MKEHDKEGNGQLDFDEFIQVFKVEYNPNI